MFDYSTLSDRVRRLINDVSQSHIDTKESTTRDSYYVVLSNEGYATVHDDGLLVNGVAIADTAFTVDRNLIKLDMLVPAASEVLIHYDMVQYTDAMILEYIDDSIYLLVEPIFNTDFEFGVGTASDTITAQDVDKDLQALFAHGAALQVLGIQVSETSGDAIYIKDGDTVINTAASSKEAMRGYEPIIKRWNSLLKTVQSNRFSGAVMY